MSGQPDILNDLTSTSIFFFYFTIIYDLLSLALNLEIRCRWKAWPGAGSKLRNIRKGQIKVVPSCHYTWAEKVVYLNVEPGLSLIPWIPHTSDSLASSSLSCLFQGRVSTWQPGLHGAMSHVCQTHTDLSRIWLVSPSITYYVYKSWGEERELGEQRTEGEAETHTHRGHFTPVKREQTSPSLALSPMDS